MRRWSPLAGGMLLNVALGSLFAWSVFVLPLEQVEPALLIGATDLWLGRLGQG